MQLIKHHSVIFVLKLQTKNVILALMESLKCALFTERYRSSVWMLTSLRVILITVSENAADTTKNAGIGICEHAGLRTSQTP